MFSIILDDDGGRGHNIPYAVAVGEACKILGWKHLGIAPTSTDAAMLPIGWLASLQSWKALDPSHGVARKIASILRLAASLRTTLKNCLQEDNAQLILMVDSFTVMKLLATLLAVMFVRKSRLNFWIFYRYEYSDNSWELRVFKWLNGLLKILLPSQALQLLTDSQPLRRRLCSAFGIPVHVMPIPHTSHLLPDPIDKSESIICWWPGQPLKSKGLETIRDLLSRKEPAAARFKVMAATESNLEASLGGPDFEEIDRLSNDEYKRRMAESDIILLPYDPKSYAYRTSGIFVEAIVAGRMPLVQRGGWMSGELEAYDLSELEFDWKAPNVFIRMLQLLNDSQVRSKLEKMRAEYVSFHSAIEYANALRAIWEARQLSARGFKCA